MGKIIYVPTEHWFKKRKSKRDKEIEEAHSLIERIRIQFSYGHISAEEADQMYQAVIDKFKLTPKEA